MKFAGSVILAAIAATASAGYSKGACSSFSSIAYSAAMVNSVNHNILYLDAFAIKMYDYYLQAASMTPWSASAPTIACENLGDFPYTNDIYTTLFDDDTQVLGLKLFFYDTLTGAQLVYKCIDEASLYDILIYALTEANYTLPSVVDTIIQTVLPYVFPGHYDLFMVFGDTSSISSDVQTSLVTAAQDYFPDFSMDYLGALDWSTC